MGQIILDKLPRMQSSIKDIAKFRGAASSHNYNQLQESIFFDVTNMFNIMSEYENRLKETSELQAIDNLYTQMKMSELEAENMRLQSELNRYQFYDPRKMLIDVFNVEPVETSTAPVINRLFNQINLKNHSTTSKLYVHDEAIDLVTIPSSLSYELNPPATTGIVDNDFKLAFNGNDNEFFVRKIISDDAMPKELEIILELPDNIISSRDINSIELCPYPYNAVDILNVEYQLNGNWTRIPGFESHKDYVQDIKLNEYGDIIDNGYIKDAENVKLCFYKVAMAKIRITLRQRTYIYENNKYTFYIGLKKLNVDCENVGGNYCEFSSNIIFKEKEPKLITSIKPYFNNDVILSDQSDEKKTLMSYEFYSVDEDGCMEYMKDSLPIVCHDKQYVLVTKMYHDRINDINPSLAYLDITYEVTDRIENEDCKCIIKNIELELKEITIPYDKEANICTILATCDTLNEGCTVDSGRSLSRLIHSENTEPHYKYKIKTSTAECYITNGNQLISKTGGTAVITVEVYYNDKIAKKDFEIIIRKEAPPVFTVSYSAEGNGKIAGVTLQKIPYKENATIIEAIADATADFTEWSDGFPQAKRQDLNVRSNISVSAIFKSKRYNVTFMAYNTAPVLEAIEIQSVERGASATPPQVPKIDGYKFERWDKSYSSITNDLIVTAIYIKQFAVKFVDYNGFELKKEIVDDGESATAPTPPTRVGYTFNGWDVSFSTVKTDLIVTAQYIIKEYKVIFQDWNGTPLKEERVQYGKAATAPSTPSRTGYTFTGWNTEFNSISSDLVVVAIYTTNKYRVQFKDHNGTLLKEQEVEHGGSAISPANPTRVGYTFTGWDKAFNNITGDLIVTAQYTILTYTVKFLDSDNSLLKEEVVSYGNPATPPANPTKEGYTFTGWDKAFSSITSVTIVTAQYSIKTYTVKFLNDDDSTIATYTVNHGNTVTPPTDPVKTGYDFTGWVKQ